MKDKRMNRIRGTVRSAHFSPDGLFLVAANIDGCLKSWKTADWSMVSHLPADKKRLGPGMQKNIAFLNNDLVLTNEHKGIFCWNYKTGKTSPFLSDDDLCMDSYSICKNVYALLIWRKYLKQTIDPDEYLDFSDDRSIVEIRNINTQNIHKQWVLDDVFFNVAQISPCGQFYILQDANEKSTAGVFLTESFARLSTLQNIDDPNCIVFSGDSIIVVYNNMSELYIAETITGKILIQLEIPNAYHDRIMNICFSPNYEVLAISSVQGAVYIYETCSGLLLKTVRRGFLGDHVDTQRSISFSPDGNNLVFSDSDYNITIYDLVKEIEVHKIVEPFVLQE